MDSSVTWNVVFPYTPLPSDARLPQRSGADVPLPPLVRVNPPGDYPHLFRFLHSLFAPGPQSVGRIDSAPIRAAVERVVDGVDPRYRAVPHYRRILSGPVERAVDYLTVNVSSLPPAIAFDRCRFTTDPSLRAWFLGPDHLLETLSFSPAVQRYLQQTPGSPPAELYAALRMDRTERTVLGMALVGDQVLRDIPQTSVSFSNHQVAFPAESELETRRQVQARAFDYLIEVARQHLASIRLRREQLEHQRRRMLQTRHRASAAGRPGPAAGGKGAAVFGMRSEPSDEAKLRMTEVELGQLRAAIATISDQLALVVAILNEPARHLRLDRVSLALDHMNIKVPRHLRKAADTLTFNDVLIGGQRRMTIELIRFPSKELRQPAELRIGAL